MRKMGKRKLNWWKPGSVNYEPNDSVERKKPLETSHNDNMHEDHDQQKLDDSERRKKPLEAAHCDKVHEDLDHKRLGDPSSRQGPLGILCKETMNEDPSENAFEKEVIWLFGVVWAIAPKE